MTETKCAFPGHTQKKLNYTSFACLINWHLYYKTLLKLFLFWILFFSFTFQFSLNLDSHHTRKVLSTYFGDVLQTNCVEPHKMPRPKKKQPRPNHECHAELLPGSNWETNWTTLSLLASGQPRGPDGCILPISNFVGCYRNKLPDY